MTSEEVVEALARRLKSAYDWTGAHQFETPPGERWLRAARVALREMEWARSQGYDEGDRDRYHERLEHKAPLSISPPDWKP